MAEKKTGAGVRVKAGVLPEVRQIRRPDFTRKAADIEKAEAERVLLQDENAQSIQEEADAAAVAASLEAQDEDGSLGEQLDESAISDEAKWYVAIPAVPR